MQRRTSRCRQGLQASERARPMDLRPLHHAPRGQGVPAPRGFACGPHAAGRGRRSRVGDRVSTGYPHVARSRWQIARDVYGRTAQRGFEHACSRRCSSRFTPPKQCARRRERPSGADRFCIRGFLQAIGDLVSMAGPISCESRLGSRSQMGSPGRACHCEAGLEFLVRRFRSQCANVGTK